MSRSKDRASEGSDAILRCAVNTPRSIAEDAAAMRDSRSFRTRLMAARAISHSCDGSRLDLGQSSNAGRTGPPAANAIPRPIPGLIGIADRCSVPASRNIMGSFADPDGGPLCGNGSSHEAKSRSKNVLTFSKAARTSRPSTMQRQGSPCRISAAIISRTLRASAAEPVRSLISVIED